MGKQPPFTVVVLPAAKAKMEALRAFDRQRVAEAVDANLLYQPLVPSRRRKPLGGPAAGFEYRPPLWELKVGDVRVFYDADEQARTVYVRAVRRKPPHKTTAEVTR